LSFLGQCWKQAATRWRVAHEGVGGRLSGQAGLTLMRYPTMEHHLSEEFM
jgi:hypothetical protein